MASKLFAAVQVVAVSAASSFIGSPPSLDVPYCGHHEPAVISSLELSSGKGKFPAETRVGGCWDEHGLALLYIAEEDPFLRNDYSKCNSETYNQEVVEVFISAKQPRVHKDADKVITKYLEVEVTPHDTLYVARITNPFGNGTNKTNLLIDCDASGIEHKAHAGEEQDYGVEVMLPWSLIDGHNDDAANTTYGAKKGDVYKGNFFRVLMQKNVSVCDSTTCAYGAWSPTFDDPPQFHVSTVFGELRLV